MKNHDVLIVTKRIITCVILTGSRLSELSNMISTNADITRGPVPSYLNRGQVTQLTHNNIVIICITLPLLWICMSFHQCWHRSFKMSTQPQSQTCIQSLKTAVTVCIYCTYMEQGQALLRSQVTELITEHKLDGWGKTKRDAALETKTMTMEKVTSVWMDCDAHIP